MSTTVRIRKGNLEVAQVLHDLIEQRILPGVGVDSGAFWKGFETLVDTFAPLELGDKAAEFLSQAGHRVVVRPRRHRRAGRDDPDPTRARGGHRAPRRPGRVGRAALAVVAAGAPVVPGASRSRLMSERSNSSEDTCRLRSSAPIAYRSTRSVIVATAARAARPDQKARAQPQHHQAV